MADAWQYGGNARAVAFSRTDRFLAVSTHDGRIEVYDLMSGVQFPLLGHTQRIFEMTFDDAETRLLTTSLDQTIRVFSLTETLIANLDRHTGAESVYAAPDGGPVVSAKPFRYTTLRAYSAKQPIEVPRAPDGALSAVRQDWRIADHYLVADGDTQLIAICSTGECPDDAIVRRFRIDFISSGGLVTARERRRRLHAGL